MKRLIVLCISSIVIAASSSFKVEGMMCGVSCVNKIKTEVDALEGVKSCDVSFEKGVMIVDYDESKLILKTVKKYKFKHTFVHVKKNNQYNLNILKDIINKTGDFVPTTSWLMYRHICQVIKKKK